MVLIPLLRMTPDLLSLTVYNDDASIFTFVFWQDQNPALFKNDLIAHYVRISLMPPGYRMLVGTFSSWFPHPLLAMHVVTFALIILSAACVFLCGHKFGGIWTACLAAVIFLQSFGVWDRIVGGHPRSFRLMFVVAGLACWLYKKEKLALVLQLIASLISPVAYALLGVAGGLRFILQFRLTSNNKRSRIIWFLLIHLVAVISLLIWIRSNPYGEVISGRETLLTEPHWSGDYPRYKLYPFLPIIEEVPLELFKAARLVILPTKFYTAIYKRVTNFWVPVVAFALLSAAILFKGYNRGVLRLKLGLLRIKEICSYSQDVLLLLASALILYLLARAIPFRLYEPARYITYSAPIVFSVLGGYIVILVGRWLCLKVARPHRFVKLLVYGTVLLSLIGQFQAHPYAFNKRIQNDALSLINFISQLPEDSLILAPGPTSDDIPLLSGRSVVWNFETYQIYHTSYINRLDTRIRSALDVILTSQWQVAKRQLIDLGVTHLVYDENTWSDPRKREQIVLSPLREEYELRLVSTTMDRLIWWHIPRDNLVYENDRFKVWRVR